MVNISDMDDYQLRDSSDWFNQGKADAWEGKPKQPPQHNCEMASLYELGYSEGLVEPKPTLVKQKQSYPT